MDRWMGKVAVVTGASSGIGLFTAKALVNKGMIVIGLARRKTEMEKETKNVSGAGKFHAMECDVTENEKVVAVFNEIKNKFGKIHVLVNSAGILNLGPTADTDVEKMKKVIDTNLLGTVYCSKQAINLMKQDDHEGIIVNLGSVMGHKAVYVEGFPMNVYPTTQFAIRGFTQSLYNELRGTKIRVTHISTGLVKTSMFTIAGVDPSFLEMAAGLNAKDVTDAIVYVLSTKSHVNVPELTIVHNDDHYK